MIPAQVMTPAQKLRVAVDLTALEDNDQLPIRFVQCLTRLAPGVDFVVLIRPAVDGLIAHLDSANVRRVGVPGPSLLEVLITRVDARVPGRARRERLTRGLAMPKRLRQAYSGVHPSLLRRTGAHVVLCPFTSSRLRDPSVPCVAAIHDLQHLSHPHLLTSAERAKRARAFTATARHAQRIICSSNSLRDVVLGSPDAVTADRVLIQAPGRLMAQRPPSPEAVAAALARHELQESTFLLCPAEFEARQNHAVVLAALGQLRARHPDSTTRIVFAGTPNARMASLRNAAERMGLAAAVQFVGPLSLEERTALVCACQAVLEPSLYESIGESVLEAMLLGRPVVHSQVPGLAELTGGAALLFDPHQPAALAVALARTEHEPGLLDRLAQLGHQQVGSLDDAETVAQSYLAVFREAQKSCLAFR